MAEVTVDVAGRSYRLACDPGEEAHVTALAKTIDAEAEKLQHGRSLAVPEGRLILMAALIVADRLSEAEAERAKLKKQLAEAEAARATLFTAEGESALADRIEALALRVEALADRLAAR